MTEATFIFRIWLFEGNQMKTYYIMQDSSVLSFSYFHALIFQCLRMILSSTHISNVPAKCNLSIMSISILYWEKRWRQSHYHTILVLQWIKLLLFWIIFSSICPLLFPICSLHMIYVYKSLLPLIVPATKSLLLSLKFEIIYCTLITWDMPHLTFVL